MTAIVITNSLSSLILSNIVRNSCHTINSLEDVVELIKSHDLEVHIEQNDITDIIFKTSNSSTYKIISERAIQCRNKNSKNMSLNAYKRNWRMRLSNQIIYSVING